LTLEALQAPRVLAGFSRIRVATSGRILQVLLCVGLGHGTVLRIGDHDVFGTEVNAASKLGEDEARAGEILATDAFVKIAGIDPSRLEPLAKAPPGAQRAWRIVGN
jgi:adenylate cyclase